MNSTNAIFIKQFRDVSKNSDVLMQFIVFPAMAFILTVLVDIPGMPSETFVNMFAKMFAGMAFVGAVAAIIAEDIEKNSLRFLLMAGIKSHEYLLGIGGVFLTIGLMGSLAFAVILPDASIMQMLNVTLSLTLGVAASILIGAIIGIKSENQQQAVGMGQLAGLLISFGPFIADMSQNDMLLRIFRFFYTMNFVDQNSGTMETAESFGIILANVLVLTLAFAWVYGSQDSINKGGVSLSKKTVRQIIVAAVVSGIGVAGFLWHYAGFIATDDAHIASTTIPVSANGGGVLERFMLQEGQHVSTDEILGWVDGGEAMRSPVNGLVIQTNAVQGQVVSPMDTIALISDTTSVHVQANIEETDILDVQVGQRVNVNIDTFGRRNFEGYVASIGIMDTSRDTSMIPVKINITDDVDLNRLIGVNASVRIPLR